MEYIIGIGLVIIFIYLIFKPAKKVEIPKDQLVLTNEFKDILNLLNNSSDSLFITGKAGTGKSTLLKRFIETTNKKFVVLAPTGIAALNVNGRTIHSFFHFSWNRIDLQKIQPDYVRADLFMNLQMVIIDEVSMVSSDLMNGIDYALRKNRNKLNEPFGGVQMVFIGDLFQLPPVVKGKKEIDYLQKTYGGQYFFDAPVFKTFKYHFKELTTIFRQSGDRSGFITMLNNIRKNEIQFEDMVLLNSRHKDNIGEQEGSTFLTTRRDIARKINKDKLESLVGEKVTYTGTLSGEYVSLIDESEDILDKRLPAPYNLELKKGALIMMLKNDTGKRWVNGSLGKIEKLEDNSITVNINGSKYTIEREKWDEVEYVLNRTTKQIEEKSVANFLQFPIQLSYAMTIHKSQGKTFDKITIDIGTGAFAPGQIYVALSRCRTLDGIVLNNPIKNTDIIVDPRIIEFYKTQSISKQIEPISTLVEKSEIKDKLLNAIHNGNKIKILYENLSGESSVRILSNIEISNEFQEFGYDQQHIRAYCHLRREIRSFRIDRIKHIEQIE